ncbi:MAG: hypothetical protein WAR79_15525 [Melioribacteraceae bacterium]
MPYINYLLVSNSKSELEKFHSTNEELINNISNNFIQNVNKINLSEEINEFIITNQNSLIYDFNSISTESYTELIKLLYFHQIIDDIFDVKFV